jgi:hypothetical protein
MLIISIKKYLPLRDFRKTMIRAALVNFIRGRAESRHDNEL